MGPFKPAGVILDESESGCWTVHHSILDYQGQWYLFYHDRDLSPAFDKNRSIRADKLAFNADGSIRKVTPTLRGVGLVQATSEIQIDRHSERRRGRDFVSRRGESARRLEDHVQRREVVGAIQRSRLRPGRPEIDRRARKGVWQGRARNPSGQPGWAGARPRESRPGARLEDCERCREEDSRWRPRPRRDPEPEPKPSRSTGSASGESALLPRKHGAPP